jgi:hypothetical protein
MSRGEAKSPALSVGLTELWAGFFQQADAQSRVILECFAWFYDPRTVRRLWLEAWSQALDGYLRSPAFLESMRTGLEMMSYFKAFQSQFLGDFARHAGVPLASDMEELAESLRRTEQVLVSQLKAIENRLANIERAHDARPPSD